MFHKMNVKNGSKDLKKYPQISSIVACRPLVSCSCCRPCSLQARTFTVGACAMRSVCNGEPDQPMDNSGVRSLDH